ncbi:MAG: hypothetical protein ACOX6D_01160 [Thermoguttaceae bacterium]|jgi:hypothetical protein
MDEERIHLLLAETIRIAKDGKAITEKDMNRVVLFHQYYLVGIPGLVFQPSSKRKAPREFPQGAFVDEELGKYSLA